MNKPADKSLSGTRMTHLFRTLKKIHTPHETKDMRKKRWITKGLLISKKFFYREQVATLKHSNKSKYMYRLALDVDPEPHLDLGRLLLCVNRLRKFHLNLFTAIEIPNTFLPGFKFLFRRRIESAHFDITFRRKITMPRINLGFLKLKSLETNSYFSGQLDLMTKNHKNIQSLNSLRVIIGSFWGPETDFVALCALINRVKSLENIELCLGKPLQESDYKLTDLSLPYLFEMIRHHPRIKKLALQIPEKDGEGILTNDFSIRSLSDSLQPPLTSTLQRLDLDLRVYHRLTGKQCGIISNGIRNMRNLESLYLLFYETCSIPEYAFLEFSSAVESLGNLSNISLDFPAITLTPKLLSQIISGLIEPKSRVWVNIPSYLSFESRTKSSELILVGKERFGDSLLSVFTQRTNIFGASRRPKIILNLEKSVNLTIMGISLLAKDLLSFENLTQIPIMLPHDPTATTNPATIPEENNYFQLGDLKKITFSIVINRTKKLVITGDDQAITEFIVGLSSAFGDGVDVIEQVDFDFSEMGALWGDTLLSTAAFFKSLGDNVKDSTIKFTKIEPEPTAKFKVTSALTQILQSGVEILLNDRTKLENSSGSGKEIDKDKEVIALNNLIKPNNLQNIKEIKLRFETNDIMPYLNFDILRRNAEKLPHMRKLNLGFENCSDFGTPEDFKTLELFVREFKDLNYLSVNLRQCNFNAAIEQFISFLGGLGKLRYLKTLILDFSGCKDIDEKSFSPLSESLFSLVELTCLDLSFQKCPRVTDSCVVALAQGIRVLKQLTTLNLSFEECGNITDKAFTELMTPLQEMPSLVTLHLNFRKCVAFSSTGFSTFNFAIPSYKGLQNLSLNFEECTKITNDDISKLFASLSSLASISHLDLNFAWNKNVSDDILAHLRNCLKNVSSLKHLGLNFHWCYKISDDGVISIAKLIANFPRLESLSLTFSGCAMIGDKALQEFSKSLGTSLKDSLTNLKLNFSECTKITDNGLKAISQYLPILTRLKGLDLCFKKCSWITDKSMMALAPAIYASRNLNELSLDFNCSAEVSNHFIAELRTLENLEKMTLCFSGFTIQEDSKKGIEEQIVKKKSEIQKKYQRT